MQIHVVPFMSLTRYCGQTVCMHYLGLVKSGSAITSDFSAKSLSGTNLSYLTTECVPKEHRHANTCCSVHEFDQILWPNSLHALSWLGKVRISDNKRFFSQIALGDKLELFDHRVCSQGASACKNMLFR